MKFMGTLVAAASLSLVAAAPAPAGAGEWDYKGSSGFYEVNGTFYSNNVSSGGGNFKACISTTFSGEALYGLFEYDPDGTTINDDELIGRRVQTAGGCETWDVSSYVDGSNNEAEPYIATTDGKAYKVEYWD
ncbi:hypothetical protein [Streptomyces sp. NBC_01361]|uniref:hypothetical protein n=1 Tax=Streptomyces sp. NBC_01361 TaxID=2903838 RepID=UPI002E327F7F|nr:hypothetical protein [Streptomyces sp. NBC_01361]